jgi:transposase
MQAYSMDLRKRVLSDSDAGLRTKQVAEKYGVSRTWVRSLKQRRRETGEIAARIPKCGRKPKIDRDKLLEQVRLQPDATLAELRARLGVQCSLSSLWMALDRLKITFKKKGSTRPSKTAPTSPRSECTGKRGKSASTRGGSSSSTKRGPTRR